MAGRQIIRADGTSCRYSAVGPYQHWVAVEQDGRMGRAALVLVGA